MKKASLLMLIGFLGLVAVLTAGFPLNYVRADHCHTTPGQTPATNVQPPAQPAPSGAERSRATRRVASPTPGSQSTRTQSVPTSPAVTPAGGTNPSIEQIYSRDLPLAIQSLERAVQAVQAGDKQAELAELSKTVTMLAAIRESLGKHVKPQFANSRCPIMGSPINSESVTAALTRDYKGQKVGFCCGGCPAAWDKLTDAEKQAKLAAVKS